MIENKDFISEKYGIDKKKFNITRGTLEDLIELVKINDGNGSQKIADAKQVPEKIGSWTEFSTEIMIDIGKGKIKYIEPNEERYDKKYPFFIFRDLPGILIRGMKTAQERLIEIKENLPEVTVIGPGMRMSEEARQEILNDQSVEAYHKPTVCSPLGMPVIIFSKNLKPLAPSIS